MLRSRLPIFAALVPLHVAASFITMFSCCYQTGFPELFWGVMFFPMLLIGLIGQTGDAAPEVAGLVGVQEDSSLCPILFVMVNSLLWVVVVYGLWLAVDWAWGKLTRVDPCTQPVERWPA